MEFTKRKRCKFGTVAAIMITIAPGIALIICSFTEINIHDSFAHSLVETLAAGFLLICQIIFNTAIYNLIEEAKLDLVPLNRSFWKNISVVGFIFVVQLGDLVIHESLVIFDKESKAENSTVFIVFDILIDVMLITAYFGFFVLIWRSTKSRPSFEDLILHEEVPELVYLQTRKLLREVHY